jgi:hypothetical protein
MVSELELFHSTKLLIRNSYYALFLILAFTVQVTKLVQFTYYNTFPKISLSTSMHFATCVRTCSSVHCTVPWNSSISEHFGIGHMYIYTVLFGMTNTLTSQNTDLSSRDILFKVQLNSVQPHANNTDKSMEFWWQVMTIRITTTIFAWFKVCDNTLLLSSSTHLWLMMC